MKTTKKRRRRRWYKGKDFHWIFPNLSKYIKSFLLRGDVRGGECARWALGEQEDGWGWREGAGRSYSFIFFPQLNHYFHIVRNFPFGWRREGGRWRQEKKCMKMCKELENENLSLTTYNKPRKCIKKKSLKWEEETNRIALTALAGSQQSSLFWQWINGSILVNCCCCCLSGFGAICFDWCHSISLCIDRFGCFRTPSMRRILLNTIIANKIPQFPVHKLRGELYFPFGPLHRLAVSMMTDT